jgi:hypothetical protein
MPSFIAWNKMNVDNSEVNEKQVGNDSI